MATRQFYHKRHIRAKCIHFAPIRFIVWVLRRRGQLYTREGRTNMFTFLSSQLTRTNTLQVTITLGRTIVSQTRQAFVSGSMQSSDSQRGQMHVYWKQKQGDHTLRPLRIRIISSSFHSWKSLASYLHSASFFFHSSNVPISYFAVRTNNKEYTHFEKRGVSFVLVSYFLPCEPFASVLNRTVPLTA